MVFTIGEADLCVTLRSGHEIRLPLDNLLSPEIQVGLIFAQITLCPKGSPPIIIRGLNRRAAQHAVDLIRNSITRIETQRRVEAFRAQIERDWWVFGEAYQTWRHLLDRDAYVTDSELREWAARYWNLPIPDHSPYFAPLLGALTGEKREVLTQLSAAVANPRPAVDARNEIWVRQESLRQAEFFDSVEKHPFTEKQRLAILYDEDNTLVIAGAGTGKTSTIIGKVGYILRKGLARPDEILLLAFTRKAAEEMSQRIGSRFGATPHVGTFHSLGLEILAQAEGRKPSLSKATEDSVQMHKRLQRIVDGLREDPDFAFRYLLFLTSHRSPYRSQFDFNTLAEYAEYVKSIELRALSGDLVKSFEELEIANWLYISGIRFEYEAPYLVDTATVSHRQYRPDFHLLESGVYIEHFCVDRDGNTPPFIDRTQYREGMEWKRNIHRDNGTTLVETYSWEKREGILLAALEEKLRRRGVVPNPIPAREILDTLDKQDYIDPLLDLMRTFLSLYKSGLYTPSEVSLKAENSSDLTRAQLFLSLFLDLHAAYESENAKQGEIDFDDMIARATDHVLAGRYRSQFQYILIDEFQDIARGRAALVQAMRKQVPHSRLFCVGDDWQAIYRFSGSDLSLMTEFESFFGFTHRVALDQTFRFNNRIADFSSAFVLKNPVQVPKTLTPRDFVERPAVAVRFLEPGTPPFHSFCRILEEIIREAEDGASVFLLERYNRFLPTPKQAEAIRKRFPHLGIDFHSAHRSKGLEADYVIVGGLTTGLLGFPTGIVDDPLLDLVLARPDEHPNGEERRLFYVAVTRARRKTFLLVDPSSPSKFVMEILKDPIYVLDLPRQGDGTSFPGAGADLFDQTKETARYIFPHLCPVCKSGFLAARNNENGLFYGCSNFPACLHTELPCSDCGQGRLVLNPDSGALRCDRCGRQEPLCPKCRIGRLVRHTSRFGPFLACTQFRSVHAPCNYKKDLRKQSA